MAESNNYDELLLKFKSVATRLKYANRCLASERDLNQDKNNWILDADIITESMHVWNYVKTFRPRYKLRCYTNIDDYTNKKGRTFKAHFTPNGKYIGTVKKLGVKPIIISSWVLPTITKYNLINESGVWIFKLKKKKKLLKKRK